MPKKQKDLNIQVQIVRMCRVHFLLALAVVAQIIIFDAWQLIPAKNVMTRWVATALFASAVTAIWYTAKQSTASLSPRRLAAALIMADVAFATFCIYNQRGMASRAVALYAIPFIVAAVLRSRSALLATAVVSAAAYSTAAVSYFVTHFNEGYRIELYGEVGFYCILMFVFAALLWRVVQPGE